MKITEHFDVPKENLHEFLADIAERTAVAGKDFTIMTNAATNSFHITTEIDYTEPEYNMLILRTMVNNVEFLTVEEKNAIEYSISSIKTLADMGVIK